MLDPEDELDTGVTFGHVAQSCRNTFHNILGTRAGTWTSMSSDKQEAWYRATFVPVKHCLEETTVNFSQLARKAFDAYHDGGVLNAEKHPALALAWEAVCRHACNLAYAGPDFDKLSRFGVKDIVAMEKDWQHWVARKLKEKEDNEQVR